MTANLVGASSTYYEWSDGKTVTNTTTGTKEFTGLEGDKTYTLKCRARYTSTDGSEIYTGWVSKIVSTEKASS